MNFVDIDEMMELFEENGLPDEYAWDDVLGGYLEPNLVRAARQEEVDFMQARGIWEESSEEECWRLTGKGPISVRWVDTNKGTIEEPAIRSRMVARDFKGKDKDREDLFAATPAWELKRVLMARTATRGKRGARKLLLIDAKKAHLNPKCEKDVFIQLADEAGGGVGKLRFWLYGFRPAAAAWEEHYARKFVEHGFRRGVANPVCFHHVKRDISVVVHGDDFTISAAEDDLNWIEQEINGWFEVKVRARLGPDPQDDKWAILLGRIVTVNEKGFEYEADPRHREIILKEFGFDEHTHGAVMAGSKDDYGEPLNEGEELCSSEAKSFRGLAARMNFLAADAPDIQHPVKEVCRLMASPRTTSWIPLKKIARYLVSRTRVRWEFHWREEPGSWKAVTDSDWAGCSRTRKSTTSGVIMLGTHCVKAWCRNQGPIALSSAEAEYYAMVDGVARAKGLKLAAEELGVMGEIDVEAKPDAFELFTDSSAAKAMASRRGSGHIRHIEVRHLWLQDEVARGVVKVWKLKGTENPADVGTKFLSKSDMAEKLGRINVRLEFARDDFSRRFSWADETDGDPECGQ